MPTESPNGSKSRHRDKTLIRTKETAQSKQSIRASQKHATQSPKSSQNEIARLKEIIDKLQSEQQSLQSKEMEDFNGSSDLRWKVNKLEKDKLELSTKYNEEVSRYEGEMAKLRAAVERGEAQRQNLEYEIALVRREAMAGKNVAEERAAALHSKNEKLQAHAAELQQRVSDLEKALNLTRRARDEDQQALQGELQERDRLLMSANAECDQLAAERKRLEALLQNQEDTLKEMHRKMEAMQEERERDTESLRRQAGEIYFVSEREHRAKMELEAAQLRVRTLEESVESERAAHLESKLNSEIIQLRIRDLEAALQVEKVAQVEAASSLELMKLKFGEVERAYEQERDKARDSLQQLAQAAARVQHAGLEEALESFRRDLEQTLRQSAAWDPRSAEEPGENRRLGLHTLLDGLRKTLGHYQDSLERTTRELRDLKKMYESAVQECKLYEEMNSTLKKNMEEVHVGLARAGEEVMRLRGECADSAAAASRAQAELSAVRQRWKVERDRASEAEIEAQRLSQLYQKDSQNVAPVSVAVEELSSLSLSPQISHLEFVCQNKSEAVRELQQTQESTFSKLAQQVKSREEDWQSQRRELEEHYASLSAEVQARAQRWQSAAEQAQEKADSLEKSRAEAAQDLARLQNLVPQTRRERGTLLAACALLAGALCPLYWQLCSLARQKALLQRQLGASRALEGEILALVSALTAEGERGGARPGPGAGARAGGARAFRRCAIAVMAAGRFCRLGQRSQILFSLEQGRGDLPALSVCTTESRDPAGGSGQDRGERHTSLALRWFQSRALLDLVLSTVGELQELVAKEDPGAPPPRPPQPAVLAAARSCFARLMERLLLEMDGASRWSCGEKGALGQRLGQGLLRLSRMAPQTDPAAAASTGKGAVAALQRLVLEFTQRLHSAEVERRSLRVELAELSPAGAPVGVPVERFESVCAELSSALEREQQAQALLHEQALQLKELGLRLELHSGEEAEKDHTLAQAVKSLSEAKTALKRKDQCLRQLSRQLSQLQQDKRQLEQSVGQAESALRLAAQSKDTLAGYVRSVESRLNDVKERILLSRSAATREDFTLQLPRVHLDAAGSERLTGGPELTACQSLVSSLVDVYQMACSRMALLEKETASRQTHIADLKSELQDACLRENQCFVPGVLHATGCSYRLVDSAGPCEVPEPPLSPQSPRAPQRALDLELLQAESDVPLRQSPRHARSQWAGSQWAESQRPGSSLSGSLKTSREPRDSVRSPYPFGTFWSSK
ncbi:coiled-coil domain-containing protein 171-like [Anguilla rostrata]|uniref:coiled-coil domain-containing protein 171-like n=1 Tax=Anguilla rostrata TaxID=7938 RepID=UPI0030CE86F6